LTTAPSLPGQGNADAVAAGAAGEDDVVWAQAGVSAACAAIRQMKPKPRRPPNRRAAPLRCRRPTV
jgi:hypothetical protein